MRDLLMLIVIIVGNINLRDDTVRIIASYLRQDTYFQTQSEDEYRPQHGCALQIRQLAKRKLSRKRK